MTPEVSVVIPVFNQVALLEDCLKSLAAQQAVKLEVIVVDDASPEDPEPVLKRFPDVLFLRNTRNLGYAAANNAGTRRATGEFLTYLNSDTVLPPDTMTRLVAYLREHPDAGGAAPLHRGPDGAVQRTCYRFPTLRIGWLWDSWIHAREKDHPALREYQMLEWDHTSERWVEHAQTSFLMLRKECHDRVEGMDERLFLFYNDTDLCRRLANAGCRLRFLPQIEIQHFGGASVQTFDRAEAQVYGDRYRYFRKWFGWRGGLAVRCALWSRALYEACVEVAHLNVSFACRKLARGMRLNRALRMAGPTHAR